MNAIVGASMTYRLAAWYFEPMDKTWFVLPIPHFSK